MTSNRKQAAHPGQPRKNLNQITDLNLKKVADLGQPEKTSTKLLTSNQTYDQ